MKRLLFLITLLILTACAAAVESPTPSPSPTATATLTPSATVTHVQTAPPAPTQTPDDPLWMTKSALDQTAVYFETVYPTNNQPDPSYTAYSPDCGLASFYECHVDSWRSFSRTATSFAEIAGDALPTPTSTPTITMTPEFHNPNPGEDIFFTPYDDDDCQLPCWQGLRIGESTIDDVQVMFDRVFGLTVTEESFITYLEDDLPRDEVAGTRMFKHFWELPGYSYFQINVVVDLDANILQGILLFQFRGDGTVFSPHSPEQIIDMEGLPDYILMSSAVEDHVDLILAYREGFVFQYLMDATISEETIEGKNKSQSTFCLNGPIRVSTYYVVPPFEDPKNEPLAPIHRGWFWKFEKKESSEDVIGLSAEEIGEMALQSDNPCFTIEESE